MFSLELGNPARCSTASCSSASLRNSVSSPSQHSCLSMALGSHRYAMFSDDECDVDYAHRLAGQRLDLFTRGGACCMPRSDELSRYFAIGIAVLLCWPCACGQLACKHSKQHCPQSCHTIIDEHEVEIRHDVEWVCECGHVYERSSYLSWDHPHASFSFRELPTGWPCPDCGQRFLRNWHQRPVERSLSSSRRTPLSHASRRDFITPRSQRSQSTADYWRPQWITLDQPLTSHRSATIDTSSEPISGSCLSFYSRGLSSTNSDVDLFCVHEGAGNHDDASNDRSTDLAVDQMSKLEGPNVAMEAPDETNHLNVGVQSESLHTQVDDHTSEDEYCSDCCNAMIVLPLTQTNLSVMSNQWSMPQLEAINQPEAFSRQRDGFTSIDSRPLIGNNGCRVGLGREASPSRPGFRAGGGTSGPWWTRPDRRYLGS